MRILTVIGLLSTLFCSNASAIKIKNIYAHASVLHNNVFSNPILPQTIACIDCNGFRSFPRFGYSLGIYGVNELTKNLNLEFGIQYTLYSFKQKQSNEVGRLYLPYFSNPTIEAIENYNYFQIPILISLTFQRFIISAGVNNSILSIHNFKSYTFNGQPNNVTDNSLEFRYHLSEQIIVGYRLLNKSTLIFGMEKSNRNTLFLRLGINYTIKKI